MPIIDTRDAQELDGHLQRFFDSNPSERPHRIRQLFTEKFDFNPATGKVSLAKAPQNVTLPSDADRIGSIEGINVVYVPLQIPGTTRVRKVEAMAAARVIAGQLGDDILLLMTNEQAAGQVSQLHVILPTFMGSTPALRRMVIERDLPRRTVLQQLSNIYHQWQQKGDLRLALEEAFDVEAVTRAFFQQYREVFERVQGQVRGFPSTDDGHEAKKLFVQTLFNRLMFIYFLSRKSWLKFNGSVDYLATLWEDYRKDKDAKNFYEERLKLLFFVALNNPRSADLLKDNPTLYALIGDVPFLNGGLFSEEEYDKISGITIPDEAFTAILHDLFDHYNFTVTESTPLDQEVAVDPEMLGKVFEELVTGRHETGSYYTPRPVVSFMCREALKGYLQGAVDSLPADAIELFVDQHDVSGLNLTSAEAVQKALAEIKVVDPACGSGAYLLGMMHELVELETALYSEKLLIDTKSLYDLKLRIIEENVYGADIDQFAVNIAMLRLWLSLAIDYESFPPLPLPNLDFKIVCGDSLIAPDPNPNNYGTLFRHQVHKIASQLADLKGMHMKATSQEKDSLFTEIEGLQGELREALSDEAAPEEGADWRVEFAEVFDQNGGFYVVIANPPYVRADAQYKHISDDETLRQLKISEWKRYRKELLQSRVYGTLYEKWDLYLPFLERAYQLLSAKGRMVFIISDAYNAAKYTQKSHEFFLNNTRIERIDFCTDIPLFQAGINNTIVHFAKATPDSGHQPLRVRRWGESHDDFERNSELLPTGSQSNLGVNVFRPNIQTNSQFGSEFVPLNMICYISYGLRANADDRYWQGEFTTNDCLSVTKDATHPKPFVQGKDLVKWWARRIWYLEWGTERAPTRFSRPTFPELHETAEKLVAVRTPGLQPKVIYDTNFLHFDASSVGIIPWHCLSGIRNKSIRKTVKYQNEVKQSESSLAAYREELEELSRQFDPKYLLAVMNSTFARKWLAERRRSKFHVYPDDWKSLPIAPAPAEEQTKIVSLVDQIIALFTKHGHPLPAKEQARVLDLEQQIDRSIAKLHKL